jgi:hypothetical protein
MSLKNTSVKLVGGRWVSTLRWWFWMPCRNLLGATGSFPCLLMRSLRLTWLAGWVCMCISWKAGRECLISCISHMSQSQALTRRKTEINYSINNSFLSRLGHKLPINDSNNVFGFESLWKSCLRHLIHLYTRGYISSKGWLGSSSVACLCGQWHGQGKPALALWRGAPKKWWDWKVTNIQLKNNYYCVI